MACPGAVSGEAKAILTRRSIATPTPAAMPVHIHAWAGPMRPDVSFTFFRPRILVQTNK
jgi:hypothetical protein